PALSREHGPTRAGPELDHPRQSQPRTEFSDADAAAKWAISSCRGNTGNGTLKSAELYDPTTGTWSVTSTLSTSSAFHTATLLPNGKVLVAGGFTCGPPPQTCGSLNGAQLYDPATGARSNTRNPNTARHGPAATIVAKSQVLV